jgi:uncharacterized protein with HEPN domain
MGVDLEAVWEITQRQLPDLKQMIQLILQTDDGQSCEDRENRT